jgi:predicted XRE-type DNA-binding protein
VPSAQDRIAEVTVDKELGRDAITYRLESGREGSVHIEQVLEFHKDPKYLSGILTYKLTIEVLNRIEESGLSRRRIAKQLGTSVPQLYRLLDPTNTKKSLNQMVSLLHVLNCDVDVSVTDKDAA